MLVPPAFMNAAGFELCCLIKIWPAITAAGCRRRCCWRLPPASGARACCRMLIGHHKTRKPLFTVTVPVLLFRAGRGTISPVRSLTELALVAPPSVDDIGVVQLLAQIAHDGIDGVWRSLPASFSSGVRPDLPFAFAASFPLMRSMSPLFHSNAHRNLVISIAMRPFSCCRSSPAGSCRDRGW